MNKKLHRQRARRAWPKLVDAARRGETVSYKDLSASIDLHWRSASWFLGVIQRYCAKTGLPRLQAMAVNKQTRVPGKGYAGQRGRRAHQREVDRVSAKRWPRQAPF
jgi:hypothetical protein